MKQPSFGQGFRALDEVEDPGFFFRLLDTQAAHPTIQMLRARSIERCSPQPGAQILEVGCGTGEVARALAARGAVVSAIDASERILEEARARTSPSESVRYEQGDAQALSFEDESFDATRIERVLQHVPDPVRALGELVRVTRPGGRVVVTDTDWGTLAFDHPDEEMTRRVLDSVVAAFSQPRIGRKLPGMFVDAGLEEISAEPAVLDWQRWDPSRGEGPPLGPAVARAVADGVLTEGEAERWVAQVSEHAAAGKFFVTVTMVLVAGRKP